MENSDQANFQSIVDKLVAEGFYAYLKKDGGVPIVFALGVRKTHSVDFRRKDRGLVIEYWMGYPDDAFVSDQVVQSFDEALVSIGQWLRRDAA